MTFDTELLSFLAIGLASGFLFGMELEKWRQKKLLDAIRTYLAWHDRHALTDPRALTALRNIVENDK